MISILRSSFNNHIDHYYLEGRLCFNGFIIIYRKYRKDACANLTHDIIVVLFPLPAVVTVFVVASVLGFSIVFLTQSRTQR